MQIISLRLWVSAALTCLSIPQTSGEDLGLWSGTGCWRHGGVSVGPCLCPRRRSHFLLRPLMIQLRSETGGQRSQGPKHPPDSDKRMKTGGGEGASTWIEKEWTREKERQRERHGGTNKNRKMENKRWKNKECEWDKSRCKEKKQGRASVGSQFTEFILEESACVSITWH